jgi:urocanate hydratase
MLKTAMSYTEAVPETLQSRTLRTFTVLHHLRPDWGGALILACGLNPAGAALALASNVAGAVCLSLEEDPAVARQALRSGACDFVVNTLDEALRAMKNEVRKHLPLSVGLQGNTRQLLTELLDRGVAPQLFTNLTENPFESAAESFKSFGALLVDFTQSGSASLRADGLLESILAQNDWQQEVFSLATSSSLRSFDERAMSVLPANDTLRRKWLQAAPRILPREFPPQRVLWLTKAEKLLLESS